MVCVCASTHSMYSLWTVNGTLAEQICHEGVYVLCDTVAIETSLELSELSVFA